MSELDDQLARFEQLFVAIYRWHDADVQQAEFERFVDLIMHDHMDTWFHSLTNRLGKGVLGIGLDWKAVDQIAFAVNRVCTAHGLTESFESTEPNAMASDMERGLHAADQWLRSRKRALLNFQTDGDYMALAVVHVDDVAPIREAFAEALVSVGMNSEPVMAIPAEWSVNRNPNRPSVDNPSMPPPPGSSQPSRSRVLVKEGPAESWFVVFEEPPHPKSYGSMRYPGPFLTQGKDGEYSQCRDINDAIAFRDYNDAAMHERLRGQKKRSVVTIAEGRELFDTDEYYRIASGFA